MAHAEDERKEFGRHLATARAAVGLSLEGVAAELTRRGYPIKKQTIGSWEKGRNLPDALWLRRLSRLYKVSLDSLAGEEPSTPTAALARSIDAIQDPAMRAEVLQLCNGLVALQVKAVPQVNDADQRKRQQV